MFTLHRVEMIGENGSPETWFAVSDGHSGFLIGDVETLEAFRRVVSANEFGEDLHRFDARLGWRWITVAEAAEEYNVPARTVRRWASRIDGARKLRGRWVFSAMAFMSYMVHGAGFK